MQPTHWPLRVAAHASQPSVVSVRQNRFECGAPLSFDPAYPGVTALEYVLGGIGADIVGTFQTIARRSRLAIDDIEAAVSGRLNNPLIHLGVAGETGHAGIERVSVTLYVSSPADPARLQQTWELTLARSPLVATFRQLGVLDLHFTITP